MNNNKEEIKWCKDNHSQPSTDWCPLCLQAVATLKDNPCSLQPSMPTAPFFLYHHFFLLNTVLQLWNMPLATWGNLAWLCSHSSHSTPWPSPLYLLQTEKGGKIRKAWHWRSTIQQQPKHWCVISTVSAKTPHVHTSCYDKRKPPSRPVPVPELDTYFKYRHSSFKSIFALE